MGWWQQLVGAQLVAWIVLLVQVAAGSSRVLPLNPGSVASFHDPKYRIDFHTVDKPYVPEDPDLEMVTMADGDGGKFECFLPKQPEPSAKDTNLNDSSISLAVDPKISRKSPEELLDVLRDNCVHRHEGWWTYELCYHGKLRQVHFENEKEKKETQEFVLGIYDPEATARLHKEAPVLVQKDPRSQTAAQKYYAHMYTNGTKCDLTNEPRETEVRFVCSETGTALISSIKEAPTCRYTVVFQAPMLCKHPLFQEERHPWLVINCNALASDTQETGPMMEDEELSASTEASKNNQDNYALLPIVSATEVD